MKICIVSDLHAYKNDSFENKGSSLLNSFLLNPKVVESDIVIFLGDVFDLLVGDFAEYKKIYSTLFDFFENSPQKRIVFIEGNHDFLCSGLFLNYKNVTYIKNETILEDGSSKIYVSHGDNPELTNGEYKLTKIALNNFVTEFLIKKIFNYKFVNIIGAYFSKSSRQRNVNRYQGTAANTALKEKYIEFAKIKFEQGHKVVVLGHNHIQEFYHLGNSYYLNNGFAQATSVFTYIEDEKPMLVSIL